MFTALTTLFSQHYSWRRSKCCRKQMTLQHISATKQRALKCVIILTLSLQVQEMYLDLVSLLRFVVALFTAPLSFSFMSVLLFSLLLTLDVCVCASSVCVCVCVCVFVWLSFIARCYVHVAIIQKAIPQTCDSHLSLSSISFPSFH